MYERVVILDAVWLSGVLANHDVVHALSVRAQRHHKRAQRRLAQRLTCSSLSTLMNVLIY
jgi:hypothetical protein